MNPSAWGTANTTLVDPDPAPGAGAGPSAWGRANATLVDPAPPAFAPVRMWDAATSSYVPVKMLIWAGAYVEVDPG